MPKDISQYFEVIPDFASFMDGDVHSLEFPLTISQLASAAQTTVHTARNYVLENLLHASDTSPGGFGLYDQCALNRLRFIREARAAGLLILDIKPLLYAINEGDEPACEDAIKTLKTKIEQRRACLDSLDSQLTALNSAA